MNLLSLPYSALSLDQLYDLLALRSEVFVVEQQCFYQDSDGHDRQYQHILAYEGPQLIGVARILPPALKHEFSAIGRYALRASHRGKGQGRVLFQYCIEQTQKLHGPDPIYIQAQAYLQKFYESFGFIVQSDLYEDAGISHIDMIRPA